jgi:hypothetical protein
VKARIGFFAVICLSACVRAPPNISPIASGGLVHASRGSGSFILGGGSSADLWAESPAASAEGRIRIGEKFDLGLGGNYGASGMSGTWLGRISPRWYFFSPGSKRGFALELGLGGGVFEGGDVDVFRDNDPVETYRATVASIDLPVRFGISPHPAWEIFGAVGPFASLAANNACVSSTTSLACSMGPLYQFGASGEVGFQWTHRSGWSFGAQSNLALGVASSMFLYNVSGGTLITAGYRFGYAEPGTPERFTNENSRPALESD